MKSHKHYHWYRLVGRTPQNEFCYYVEAESPHTVIKLHGGKRKILDTKGTLVMAEFPTREKDVSVMPAHFLPTEVTAEHINPVTRIFPATRYTCTCGKIHVSEYPYKSMWCTCGQKAFPQILPNEQSSHFPVQASAIHQISNIEPQH